MMQNGCISLLLPLALDAQFGTPYPISAGFDTDIDDLIESSTVTSKIGLMARLVIKDNITSGGALAVGQTLRLGGFVMTARSAALPTMTSRLIKNSLHISSKFTEQMDPMELSSLNELLDRIAALGVATDYDRIGLKPDQREINSPPVTHQIAVVEEQCGDSPSILRTNYVRIPKLPKPDTHSREDTALALNPESGRIPNPQGNIPEPELPRSETPLPRDLKLGQGPDLNPPTHPDTNDLSHIRQAPQETVHHYWARFLLVMNKVKDCREGRCNFALLQQLHRQGSPQRHKSP